MSGPEEQDVVEGEWDAFLEPEVREALQDDEGDDG